MNIPRPPLPAPVYDWTGLYVGGEIGGAFGTSRKDFFNGLSTGNFNTSGVIGGFTTGYNRQFGPAVVGLEADISGTDVQGQTSSPNPLFNYGTQNHWLATVRGRLGYAFNRFMPFVSGGLAEGDVRVFSSLKTTGGNGVNFTQTQPGWTVGGGLETAIYANWTIKAEYLYVQFNDTNGPSDVGRPTTTKFAENIGRAGFNYKFNWSSPAAAGLW
jgi:outer membrane immunogenic protein